MDLSALGIKCGAKKFLALCDELDRDDGRLAKLRGDKSATLKAMEEDHGVHKAALKAALKVRNMDAVQAGEWLRHFEAYLDLFDVRAQSELAFEQAKQEQATADKVKRAGEQPAAGTA